MKKIFLMSLSLVLFFLVSINAGACSCAPLRIEELIDRDDSSIFSGKIYKVISSTKIIVEVEDNYSTKPIDKYVIVYTKTSQGASCGIDFEDFKTNEILVVGELKNGKISTNACSSRGIYDGSIYYIELGDNFYEYLSMNTFKQYAINLLNEKEKEPGDIRINDVNQVIREATLFKWSFVLLCIGGASIVVVSVIAIKKVNNNKKYKIEE